MDPLRIGPFLGANKALHPKLLPAGVGVNCLNRRADRGDLRGWAVPLATGATAPGDTKTMLMLGRDATSDSVIWLVWDVIVHAVRGLSADDTTKRTYYTGDGAPKVTNNIIGLAGAPYPTSYRDLGIPKPGSTPTVTETTPGDGDEEDRYYAFAYVSDWDEIGPPVVSARITCKPGAHFDITGLPAPPTGPGENRGINRIRVWRTVASGVGDFFFVRDVALPATTTTDNDIAVGSDTMLNTLWYPPPADLTHLTDLWNGMFAGISGKAVRYCEPFKAHAWPAPYETLCTDTPIALGVFEKSLVIATTGRPRLVTGSSPEAMDDSPIEFNAGCVSARSMVSMGHGVCWATSDGLAYVGANGAPRLLTASCMLLEHWQALNPSTIVGVEYGGRYFGFYDSGAGRKGFVVDPLAPETIDFLDVGYEVAHFDRLGEQMYVLDGTAIKRWNAGAALMATTFTSKVYRLPRPDNPVAAEVIADTYPVTFKLWAGRHSDATGWPAGSLKLTKTVTSRDEFWLPGGYMADDVQVEVIGGPVTGMAIVGDLEDLKRT